MACWTDEEIQYLKDNIGFKTYRAIGKILGRSETAVIVKSKRLQLGGFKNNMDYITLAETAELLGVNRKTVYDLVIKNKIPSIKKIVIKGGKPLMLIKYDNAVKFAETYKKQNFKKWSKYEESILLCLLSQGKTHKEIAKRLGRSEAGIQHKISKLRRV